LIDLNHFDRIRIGLASPEQICAWSSGEVKKPETINYRTLKPERDGLFCERIFGPTRDWECHCGKYKRVRYKGVICDRCGVEVTRSKVRRERLGHIELAAPVSHIWYFKGIPSRMGLLLDMSPRALEKVLYFVSYIVTDPGETGLIKKQLLTESEYRENREKYENKFKAGMGAEAVKKLLEEINLDDLARDLRQELKEVTGQRKIRAIRRLEVVEAFRKSGNRPEWMIMDMIPVVFWVLTLTPGPIVDDTEMVFRYCPLAAAGLARTSASIRVRRFSTSFSVVKEILPMGAWMFPALSTRYSILPAFTSWTALAISKVTVPVLGLGIRPRGPRIRPSLPTLPIMSGVAMATSKPSQPSCWTLATMSSAPTKSAPACSASLALSPLANTSTVRVFPVP
jgi:hypothetical protein